MATQNTAVPAPLPAGVRWHLSGSARQIRPRILGLARPRLLGDADHIQRVPLHHRGVAALLLGLQHVHSARQTVTLRE